MRTVSLEVAEHVLREHLDRTGDDLTPYRVTTCRGFCASRDPEFVTMADVRDEIRMRAGRHVTVNQAYRVQQWLAAEAAIARRWPEYRTHTIAREMLSGLDFDDVRMFPIGPRRRGTQTE